MTIETDTFSIKLESITYNKFKGDEISYNDIEPPCTLHGGCLYYEKCKTKEMACNAFLLYVTRPNDYLNGLSKEPEDRDKKEARALNALAPNRTIFKRVFTNKDVG